ncbi:MAG: four helix bundle protein [Phycisphaeraceae bacterium]|nr:four helix bundle protein [Phycisphaeraceae bacterium]
MKVKTFRDLLIWQKGMILAREIYLATRKMPKEEMFCLTNQMRRAACSIPMNIAEGYCKYTRPEYMKGLRTAIGSLGELSTAYEIATSLEMIPVNPGLIAKLAEEDRMIQSLLMKLDAKTKEELRLKKDLKRKK